MHHRLARDPFTLALVPVLALALAGTLTPVALAQHAGAKTSENAKPDEQLRDFVHYTLTANYALAGDYARALLARMPEPFGKASPDAALTPAAFAKLVEGSGELTRFMRVTGTGQRVAELEPVASQLLRAYEQGKLDTARDASEITKNIEMLGGTQTQRLYARERLAAAGEYALPQLLSALTMRGSAIQQAEVRQIIVDMQRQSVAPLCAALGKTEPTTQELLCNILGQITYRASIPYLADLASRSSVPAVKDAALRAIKQIDAGVSLEGGVGTLYTQLAEAYYAGQSSLVSFPRDSHQLVWEYAPQTGLTGVPVRTELFASMMAMRLSERALGADAGSREALALWIASNFKREQNTPDGYTNPLYGSDKREAMYYAVAAGAAINQRVLARAIDTRDTHLARKAVAAIEKTAGAALMAGSENARRPLLAALRYPSRRVQYEAALAIASAMPSETFDGSERVVPILAGAIRDAGTLYAAVIASDAERAASLTTTLSGMGYTVLPAGTDMTSLESAIAPAPGIDLLVLDLPSQRAITAAKEARGHGKLGATPVLALADLEGTIELTRALDADAMFATARLGGDAATTGEAIKQLVAKSGAEPIAQDEAAGYQTRALSALRDIGLAGSTIFTLNDAAVPLTGVLSSSKGATRLAVGEVLARINDRAVQGALADAAIDADDAEVVQLMGKLAESAKRFGNLLQPRHITRLSELARTSTGERATSVAGVLGTLNLPNTSLVPMILGTK